MTSSGRPVAWAPAPSYQWHAVPEGGHLRGTSRQGVPVARDAQASLEGGECEPSKGEMMALVIKHIN